MRHARSLSTSSIRCKMVFLTLVVLPTTLRLQEERPKHTTENCLKSGKEPGTLTVVNSKSSVRIWNQSYDSTCIFVNLILGPTPHRLSFRTQMPTTPAQQWNCKRERRAHTNASPLVHSSYKTCANDCSRSTEPRSKLLFSYVFTLDYENYTENRICSQPFLQQTSRQKQNHFVLSPTFFVTKSSMQ